MLRRFWRGGYSLAASFWLFYVLGFFVASIVLVLAAGVLYRLHLEPFGRVLLVSIPLYSLFAAVGVWRSATAYPFNGVARFWAWAAKGIVGFYSLCILYQAANGGAARVAILLME